MTTRRLSRADVDREHTLEWLMARDDAQTRRCPTCRARTGVTCVNVHTGRELTGQPAHLSRLARPAATSTSDPSAACPPAVPRPREPGPSPSSPRPAGSAPTPALVA